MQLRRLEIQKLPGIEPGFVFEAQRAGVHLVVGPNAIGKSSLVRALKYLLAIDRSDPPALALSADFTSGDTRWRVDRQGRQIVWRRNGEISPPPGLAGADQIGLYRLSVEHLLDIDDANDREMARLLRRELYGNFDLEELRAEVVGKTKKRGLGSKEANALAAARDEVHRVESEYAALSRRERDLPGLEQQIEAAQMAAQRSELLRRAVGLTEALSAKRAREETLAVFPSGMEDLRGDELDRIRRLEEARRGVRDELRKRRDVLGTAEAELQLTGLADSCPASEEMEVAQTRLQRLVEVSVEYENAEEACAEAAAALSNALAQLNLRSEPPRIDADVLQRSEEISRPLAAATYRRLELKEQLVLAGEPPERGELERQRNATEALRAWLARHAADRTDVGRPETVPRAVLGAAVAAAVLAALAAYLEEAPGAFVGAMGALAASGVALWLRCRRRSETPALRDEAIRRYEETGLARPFQWDEDGVRQHLQEVIEPRLSELILMEVRAVKAGEIRVRLEATEAEIEELEGKRAALAAEIGFDPTWPVVQTERFLRLCTEWDSARKRHSAQKSRLDHLGKEVRETAALVRDFVLAWRVAGSPTVDDALGSRDFEQLRGALDELGRRSEEARSARKEIGTCKTAIRSLKRRIAELDEEANSLFEDVGLSAADHAELGRRIEQLPQWSAARAARDKASTEEELLRDQLADAPEILELVGQGLYAQLQADLEGETRAAEKYTTLIEERAQIETKLQDAGKDRKLENVRAAENRARRALEERRDDALLAVAMEALLDDVDGEFKADQEPGVLRRAREIFGEVTAHAFDLQLGAGGMFIAHDLAQKEPRSLMELSSGTRMQLLLALRLAWTEARERGGEALPLFLDEAMTTSDEGRFATMAKSLERVAGSDDSQRQIFYLSARRHEPLLWQQVTGSQPTVVDLSAVRFPQEAVPSEDYRVTTLPVIQAPEGRSADEYGSSLGVPAINAHLPAESFHIFHLLRDDLDLLHTLMEDCRINTIGQLDAWLQSDGAKAVVGSEDSRCLLMRRCRITRTWADLWREGRGRPVDRSVLEQSKAISKSYIDRAADLIEELQGDGEVLIRKLREKALRGFRSNKIDQLQRWLSDNGFVDDRERLSREDRLRGVLLRIEPQSEDEVRGIRRSVEWLETAVRLPEN